MARAAGQGLAVAALLAALLAACSSPAQDHTRRATELAARQEDAAAVAELHAAIALEPDLQAALSLRGGLLIGLGEPQAALADAERAVSLDPRQPTAYLLRAEERPGPARAAPERARELASDVESRLSIEEILTETRAHLAAP